MEFGKTLREAREAKGYTIAQLADLTHIMSRTLEGMEAEDFSSIPAPIYGRGFVKLCCQHLGLDQQTMIDEFMAIFNGEKPAARPAPIAPAPTPDKPAAPEPEDRPEPSIETAPPTTRNFGELFSQSSEPAPVAATPSRFAPPQPQDDRGSLLDFAMSGIPWRLVLLIAGALAILVIAIMSCRAIYRELSEPAEKPAAIKVVPAARAPDAAKAPRTPKPVKPLYID